MITCDICMAQFAEIEILLEKGNVFYSCKTCFTLIVSEQVSTDNPVHSITEIEEE